MKLKKLLNEIVDSQQIQIIKRDAENFISRYHKKDVKRPNVIINNDSSVSFDGQFLFTESPKSGTFEDFFSNLSFKIKGFYELRANNLGLKNTEGFSNIEIQKLSFDDNLINGVSLNLSIKKFSSGPSDDKTPFLSLAGNPIKNLNGLNITTEKMSLYLDRCKELESLEGLNNINIKVLSMRDCNFNLFRDDISKYKIEDCLIGKLPADTVFPLFYITLFNRPKILDSTFDNLPQDLQAILRRYKNKPDKSIGFINELIEAGYDQYLP